VKSLGRAGHGFRTLRSGLVQKRGEDSQALFLFGEEALNGKQFSEYFGEELTINEFIHRLGVSVPDVETVKRVYAPKPPAVPEPE
jgi:hypothetical protein